MASIVARKGKSGTRYTAQIRIHRQGRLIHSESETFNSRAAAKAWAASRETEIRSDPHAAARSQHRTTTVGDLIRDYVRERNETDPLGRTKSHHLALLSRQAIADLPATRLSAADLISHVRSRRLAGTGAATVNNDLVWLRVVLRYARSAWGIPVDPHVVDDASETCARERLTAKSRRRDRRPTPDELRRISDWFRRPAARKQTRSPHMYLIMWAAIYSARRQDELCRMRLSDYDAQAKTWLIRDLKHPGGSAGHDAVMIVPDRLVPVVDAAIQEIRRDADDDRLFPYDPRTVSAAWTRAMHVLGIEDLRFHDLRHEACSRLAESGRTIPEIQQVSLHESWGSLQRYVQMRPSPELRIEYCD